MDVLAMLLICLAIAVPVASVLIAARLWRAQLVRPARFVAAGLSILYLFTSYLMVRPIPTHAVAIGPLDVANTVDQGGVSMAVQLALLTFVEVTGASIAVVLVLRRIMSR
jgi:hypothetical protein